MLTADSKKSFCCPVESKLSCAVVWDPMPGVASFGGESDGSGLVRRKYEFPDGEPIC
jgi:hypothetical protein